MSKRFTETTKWNDPWFRRLTPAQKCLWNFICDLCDSAGVIDLDLEMASFQIGGSVSEEDLSAIKSRLEKLPSGKWRIIKFLAFQYGELSAACPAHKPIFKALESHGLKGVQYPIDTLSDRVQEKEKDKETEKDGREGVGGKPPTEAQVLAYASGCAQVMIPKDCALRWLTDRETSDWMRPKGLHMLPVLPNWQSDLRGYAQDWNKREEERKAKTNANATHQRPHSGNLNAPGRYARKPNGSAPV